MSYWERPDARPHWDSVIEWEEQVVVRRLVKNWPILGPESVVFDVGCGRWDPLRLAASARVADRTWLFDKYAHGHPEIIQAPAHCLPAPRATADLVIMCRTLSNVLPVDRPKTIVEIRRVLKPGGHLILIDSWQPGVDAINAYRTLNGVRQLPPAHTGSIPLQPKEQVSSAGFACIARQDVAKSYLWWTRARFPTIFGRYPEGSERFVPQREAALIEVMPEPSPQRAWLYRKC